MNLINRAKNILVTPKTEWNVISTETASIGSLLKSYILPLSLVPVVVGILINLIRFGYLPGGQYLIYAIISPIITFGLAFVIATYAADALAPTFKSKKSISSSAQAAAYPVTTIIIAHIFIILLPQLYWIFLVAGLGYAVYILYAGILIIKNTPEDQKIIYSVIIVLVYYLSYYLLNQLLFKLYISAITPTIPRI